MRDRPIRAVRARHIVLGAIAIRRLAIPTAGEMRPRQTHAAMSKSVIHTNPRFAVTARRVNENVHYFLEKPDAVRILLYDSDRSLVLLERFQPSTQRKSLELPGGRIDDGETPLTAVIRETREETGFDLPTAEKLLTLKPAAQILSERVHVFHHQTRTPLGELVPRAPDEADALVTRVPFAELMDRIRTGGIDGGVDVAAILYWSSQYPPAIT